jgi:transposase
LLDAGTSQRQIGRLTGVDRKTIRSVQLGLAAGRSNSPGVATGSALQTPPPWPPAPTTTATTPTSVSACEPHRTFIEAQLRLKRNFMAIYQDLVDQHGFAGAYNSVKRFAGGLRERAPEQFDRLEFAPGEEAQVDYGEGALTRVPRTERYRKPRLFVMTLRYSRRSYCRVVWKSSKEAASGGVSACR